MVTTWPTVATLRLFNLIVLGADVLVADQNSLNRLEITSDTLDRVRPQGIMPVP